MSTSPLTGPVYVASRSLAGSATVADAEVAAAMAAPIAASLHKSLITSSQSDSMGELARTGMTLERTSV
jgi:hypothetical protein